MPAVVPDRPDSPGRSSGADRPQWPEPPRMPEPPRRTEPLHIPTVLAPSPECADPAAHYACEAVEGLDPLAWEGVLRARFAAGYRLAQVVGGAYGGRAVLVFEHRHG